MSDANSDEGAEEAVTLGHDVASAGIWSLSGSVIFLLEQPS